MAPELSTQYPPSLHTIFISQHETCDIHWFIRQYVESRNLSELTQVLFDISSTLTHYPGQSPVRLFELNAWLDHNFRSRAFFRPVSRSLKLIVNNDHIPQTK